MDMLKTTFIDNDIPVIIGEYGCPVKNKELDSIRRYLMAVCVAAYNRDICPIMWDVTDAQYDRTNCKLKDEALKQGLFAVLDSGRSVGKDANAD